MKLLYGLLAASFLILGQLQTAANADQVTLINQTKQPLCFYTGNNLVNCNFAPGSKVFMELPTHTLYHGQNVTNTTVTVTDVGKVIESTRSNGAYTQRQSLTLCQKRTQAQLQIKPSWEIKPGFDAGCNVGPRYKMDRP